MGFWEWLNSDAEPQKREEETPKIEPPVSDVLLNALMSEETITREKALTLPAVSGAVDLISNAVASMPVKLYKYKQGKVEEVEGDVRVSMLNGDTHDTLDAYQLKKAMVTDYLLGKGGYCYIERDRNDVTGLFYVEDRHITVLKNYKPIHKDYLILVEGQQYQPFDFVKLLRNTTDGASGIGITVELSKMLETAYQTLLYQLGLVKSGGNKKGFLKSQRRLAQEEINVLKKAWRQLYANNEESVVVLNNGLEFQEASNSSVEMQLNESKRTLMDEINALFHIYPNNFDQTFKEAIYPIVKAFETALNRDLLLEKEKKNCYFELDVKEIIRASLKERYEAYKLAKETGFMTINEIRRSENMNYIEGLDVVNVGLGAVLYNVETQTYYTPNTDSQTSLEEDHMLEGHELAEEFDESGNSADRAEDLIAVDFDNTLTKDGIVNDEAINKIKELQKTNKIILWTARTGDRLEDAISICKAKGLVFDGVASEKPDAKLFIDDNSVTMDDLLARYNEVHDKSGRFGSKGGSGGGGSSSSASSGSDSASGSGGSGGSDDASGSGDSGSGSGGSGAGSSSGGSDAFVDDMQAEFNEMPNNKKAIYLMQNGFLNQQDALTHMQDGTIDQEGEKYFQILRENGDYTPKGETRDNSDRAKQLVDSGEQPDHASARKELIKRNTGFDDADVETTKQELDQWFSNSWDKADTAVLDKYVENAPTYDGVIHRGMHFDSPQEAESFAGVQSGDRIKMKRNASWTDDETTAKSFAHNGDDSQSSVMITCLKNRSSAPVAEMSSKGEREVLSSSKAEWTVLRKDVVTLPNGNKKIQIYVVEAGENG